MKTQDLRTTFEIDDFNYDMLNSLSELYHENTKIPRFPFSLGHKALTKEDYRNVSQACTIYHDLPTISLSSFELPEHAALNAIKSRRSRRDFAPSKVSLQDLAALLETANGVTARFKDIEGNIVSFRASPSAGALYPIEIYLAVQSVKDLPPGIYHHEPTREVLSVLSQREVITDIVNVCGDAPGVENASCAVLLAANLNRVKSKYGERGYRYALLDAGHLMQSIWITAEVMQLAFYSIGGFNDDAANSLLSIDGVENVVCYVALFGTR